jgi:16S rRNA (cytosine1402-N4)-methyltransferase
MAGARHEPVLVREVLGFLRNGPGVYLDATIGGGGHAAALLETEPGARILGCDRDPGALAESRARLAAFGSRVMLSHARFSELPRALAEHGVERLRGALLDLGLSSLQLDDPARGLSFQSGGPLDFRMDPTRGPVLADKLAGVAETELADVLAREGEVPRARAVARALLRARDQGALHDTRDLVHAAARGLGSRHPRRLAQVFQALRRWVNEEGADLQAALEFLARTLEPGGVLVTLAYHSGEDRTIKQAIRGTAAAAGRFPDSRPTSPWEAITRRVVTPSDEEVARNPRARSAKLRAARRRG